MNKRLTEEVCQSLYKKYKTPEHVIGHCRAVGDTGFTIAEALDRHGYNFDAQLIKMAGYAHDVMRLHEDHGRAAYEVLKELGYVQEAEIVKNHMYYTFNDFKDLNETDIMCLADRLVKEDKYVGLDERVAYLIDKPGKTPERTKFLLGKKTETQEFIHKIEESIGQTIDSLFDKR